MEVSEYFTINVRLGSMHFPITIKRKEEEIYRKAEKQINERLNFYASRYQNQGSEAYMAMAMLDIALSLKRLEMRQDTEEMVKSVRTLTEEIENVLKENKEK